MGANATYKVRYFKVAIFEETVRTEPQWADNKEHIMKLLREKDPTAYEILSVEAL